MVAGHGLIEARRVIGDHAGEHVEPGRSSFWDSQSPHIRRQREMLLDLGHIDAAGFQHRAMAQVDGVQHEALDLLRGGRGRPRHEARPHAVDARA